MELDLQVSPEEIMSREVGAGLRTLDFFRFELFLNSSATDIVLSVVTLAVLGRVTTLRTMSVALLLRNNSKRKKLKQQLRSAVGAACSVARGHRLNAYIALAAVHGLSGLFRAVSAVFSRRMYVRRKKMILFGLMGQLLAGWQLILLSE